MNADGPVEPPATTPALQGTFVALRPPTTEDSETLLEFFADPVIERRWFPHDAPKVAEMIQRSISPLSGTGSEEHFGGWVVMAEQAFAGWIQAWEDLDPEYPSGSIDIAVAPRFHGSGVATDALRTVMRYLLESRGHHRITIDPELDNERAVAAYRKVGFRDVGVMRHYCRRPDGELSDGLLMEYVVGIDSDPTEPAGTPE